MSESRRPPARLDDDLRAWLDARDPGPAPVALRLAIARVPSEPAAPRFALRTLVRPAAALAGLAAVVALVAVALSIRTIAPVSPVGGAARPATPSGWSAPAQLPLLALIDVAQWLLFAAAAAVALLWLVQRGTRIAAEEVEAAAAPADAASEDVGTVTRPPRRIRRTLLAGLGVLLVAAVVYTAANVAGAVRFPGGPFMESDVVSWLQTSPDPPMYGAGYGSVNAGERVWDASLPLTNGGPWPIEIERVTGLASDPDLVSGVYVTADGFGGRESDMAAFVQPSRLRPLPVVLAPGDPRPAFLAVALVPPRPGYFRLDGVVVEYRAGPFHFSRVLGEDIDLCAGPLPAGLACPNHHFFGQP